VDLEWTHHHLKWRTTAEQAGIVRGKKDQKEIKGGTGGGTRKIKQRCVGGGPPFGLNTGQVMINRKRRIVIREQEYKRGKLRIAYFRIERKRNRTKTGRAHGRAERRRLILRQEKTKNLRLRTVCCPDNDYKLVKFSNRAGGQETFEKKIQYDEKRKNQGS